MIDHTPLLLRLRESALTDTLTRVGNREAAIHYLRTLCPESTVSVVMVDLDHFKRVNDEHGHDVGDRVLVTAADKLSEFGRVFRFGGEEFVLIEPGSISFARVNEWREELPMAVHDPVPVTASLGLAIGQARDFEHLLKCADLACYAAKRAGRNRVCCSTTEGPEPPRTRQPSREPARTEFAVTFADGHARRVFSPRVESAVWAACAALGRSGWVQAGEHLFHVADDGALADFSSWAELGRVG